MTQAMTQAAEERLTASSRGNVSFFFKCGYGSKPSEVEIDGDSTIQDGDMMGHIPVTLPLTSGEMSSHQSKPLWDERKGTVPGFKPIAKWGSKLGEASSTPFV